MKTEIDVYSNGRVNLLGEHLDYNGGSVLPLQINKSVRINLKENYKSNEIVIISKQYKDEIKLDGKFQKINNWADFIIGACKIVSTTYNISISKIVFNIDSNLPIGIGLSSSAATTISAIKALLQNYNIKINNQELVDLALKVERDFVNVGGGIMDQFSSVYGSTEEILFLDTMNNNYELIPLPKDYYFLIIDSGTSRILSNSKFNKKKEVCKNAAKKLKVKYLCEISEINEKFYKELSEEEIKVAKHVITENLRVKKGKESLLNGDLETFGKLMTESHLSLKNDYQVSSMELDQLVDLANQFGALGAKLTGAGFGGAIVALVKKSLVEKLKTYILKYYSRANFI